MSDENSSKEVNVKIDRYGTPFCICSECASKVAKRMPTCATFYTDICDVCCEWKSVTHPRNYGYPKVLSDRDKSKILKNLEHEKTKMAFSGEKLQVEAMQIKIDTWKEILD
jgi:hypothetical protein